MGSFAKFLCGAAAASLLAWGGSDEGFIDNLEAQGKAALGDGGFEGVDMSMARDPLSRIALLDGVSDPAKRAEIEAAMLKVPGVASVRWAGEADAVAADPGDGEAGGAGALAAEATSGASEEQVADCQSDIDAFMDGKVINFNSGSAFIAPASGAIISDLAEKLTACSGMAIAVEGHTDATGSAEINTTLSQARADAVASALNESGVAAERITATGFGSSQLLVPGDGANAANRRIEFTLNAGGADAPAAQGEE